MAELDREAHLIFYLSIDDIDEIVRLILTMTSLQTALSSALASRHWLAADSN